MASSLTAALILSSCSTACFAQQANPSAAPPPAQAIAANRAALIAQCPPVKPRISKAEEANYPIHITHWGSTGPRVLLIHGGVQGGAGGGPLTFSKQEALAQKGWRVDAVDRPGFGQSPSRGIDDQEADAVWIAELLTKGTNLIGHSWGGTEVLLAAAKRPQDVSSLIIIEPALQSLLLEDKAAMANPAVRASMGQIQGFMATAKTPAEYGKDFAGALGASGVSDDHAAALPHMTPEQATATGCALLQAGAASPATLHKAMDTIAKAGIPVLVISGGWNPRYDAVSEIAARLMHGTHVIVKSPNHFVQSSNPGDFNRVVDAFMRKADRTRGDSASPAQQ